MPSTPEAVGAAVWPESGRARDRFVRERRPERPQHDPRKPQGVLLEEERTAEGEIASVATVFLTGRECPWRCAMCDLWTYTTAEDTPRGAIPHQLDLALAERSLAQGLRPRAIKLYNASSFFDARAVPLEDYDAIARRLAPFDRVVVESHPALVGERVDRLLEALNRHRGPGAPSVELQVAMGLETANPEALALLNKGMTLELFASAASTLRERGVSVRAFLLAPPPFVPAAEEAASLRRSIEFAFANGVSVISLIPTRMGNGALEALEAQGLFRRPHLADLERALAGALPEARGRVFADLWDLERFARCSRCLPARQERLRLMNLHQVPGPPLTCTGCSEGAAG